MTRLLVLLLIPLTLACEIIGLPREREVDEVLRLQEQLRRQQETPVPPAPLEVVLLLNQDRFEVRRNETADVRVRIILSRGGQPASGKVTLEVINPVDLRVVRRFSADVNGEQNTSVDLPRGGWIIRAAAEGGGEDRKAVDVVEVEETPIPVPTRTPLPIATLVPTTTATPVPAATRVPATATPTAVVVQTLATPTATPSGITSTGPEFDWLMSWLAQIARVLNR